MSLSEMFENTLKKKYFKPIFILKNYVEESIILFMQVLFYYFTAFSLLFKLFTIFVL